MSLQPPHLRHIVKKPKKKSDITRKDFDKNKNVKALPTAIIIGNGESCESGENLDFALRVKMGLGENHVECMNAAPRWNFGVSFFKYSETLCSKFKQTPDFSGDFNIIAKGYGGLHARFMVEYC